MIITLFSVEHKNIFFEKRRCFSVGTRSDSYQPTSETVIPEVNILAASKEVTNQATQQRTAVAEGIKTQLEKGIFQAQKISKQLQLDMTVPQNEATRLQRRLKTSLENKNIGNAMREFLNTLQTENPKMQFSVIKSSLHEFQATVTLNGQTETLSINSTGKIVTAPQNANKKEKPPKYNVFQRFVGIPERDQRAALFKTHANNPKIQNFITKAESQHSIKWNPDSGRFEGDDSDFKYDRTIDNDEAARASDAIMKLVKSLQASAPSSHEGKKVSGRTTQASTALRTALRKEHATLLKTFQDDYKNLSGSERTARLAQFRKDEQKLKAKLQNKV